MDKRTRILIGKVGLDGHDVGARVVAMALADAGMEVIYTGVRQTPEQIAHAAIQEGVDLIGISILSGSHMTLFPAIMKALKENDADDIPLVAGGIIPTEDIQTLKEMGVKEVFLPETSTSDIIDFIRSLLESNA